jgi:PLP dependent protein
MSVTQALGEVRMAIGRAEQQAGRLAGSVELIAVSKTYDGDRIRPVLEVGQRQFGENRVQEAAAKWPDLRAAFSGITLHLIGPLQSNKARDAVALFDVIHTIDRDKIAAALASEMRRQSRFPKLLIEVNTGEEPQKAGIAPAETLAFVQRCRMVHGLEIAGLMCIPPADADPTPHFQLLDALTFTAGLAWRSMGMSADYPAAIAARATHVRVGSAIFGQRNHAPRP